MKKSVEDFKNIEGVIVDLEKKSVTIKDANITLLIELALHQLREEFTSCDCIETNLAISYLLSALEVLSLREE